jgi:preprotein translocase subunit SecB
MMGQPRQKEPKIQVRIKPRAKDHTSDDFKLVVTYQVELSIDEQANLKNMVPSTPIATPKLTGNRI